MTLSDNIYRAMYGEHAAQYTPGAIVNWFLHRSNQLQFPITQMKLQKLLYFAHGWNLALNSKPLVNELPEAWEYGPVFPSVYHEFKKFGNQPIPSNVYMNELRKGSNDSWNFVVNYIDAKDTKTLQVLEYVWANYSPRDAITLSQWTHKNDPENPWIVSMTWAKHYNAKGASIPNPMVENYFRKLQSSNQPY